MREQTRIWVRAANETACECNTDVRWEQDPNGPIKCGSCNKVITTETLAPLNYIWIRADRKKVDIRGVDQWYLKAIEEFAAQGNGYGVTDSQIRAIYKEMEDRGIAPRFHVEHALTSWRKRRGEEMADNEMLDAGDFHE